MVKYCIEKYPMGSFKKQKSPGRFMNDTYYENIKIIAKNIMKDISPIGILSSSTFEVGAGKSVFAQQTAEAYTELVNKYYGLNLEVTKKNIVFRAKDLIERAFKVPKYSCLILDEWEDAHYWSELGVSLRKFFRKCRQLNLFLLLIIPNLFQLPIGYAISRSLFFVDVRFVGEFERGYFSFYNFNKKKELYLKGKKTMNYNVVRPNFTGRFPDGYAFPREEYLHMKYLDMLKYDNEEKKVTKKDILIETFRKLHENLGEITTKRLAEGFGISERTGFRWLSKDRDQIDNPLTPVTDEGAKELNLFNKEDDSGGVQEKDGKD